MNATAIVLGSLALLGLFVIVGDVDVGLGWNVAFSEPVTAYCIQVDGVDDCITPCIDVPGTACPM